MLGDEQGFANSCWSQMRASGCFLDEEGRGAPHCAYRRNGEPHQSVLVVPYWSWWRYCSTITAVSPMVGTHSQLLALDSGYAQLYQLHYQGGPASTAPTDFRPRY